MTTNKPMTGEQLDELMTVAVNMQRDSEKVGERSVAMFAYAVQVAVLELRKVRDIKPADEDHVAAMNSITAIIAILGSSDTLGISEQVAELKAQRDGLAAENAGLKEANGIALKILNDEETMVTSLWASSVQKVEVETPVTDAFMAEVRAASLEDFADVMADSGHYDAANYATTHAQKIREEAAQ
ncbi:hypothetical protein [Enterobacter soli]|uniref:hypothetical protein n=1 Tax=Enterobacter soli TaxID=885040 RepID=UPI003EDB1F97